MRPFEKTERIFTSPPHVQANLCVPDITRAFLLVQDILYSLGLFQYSLVDASKTTTRMSIL